MYTLNGPAYIGSSLNPTAHVPATTSPAQIAHSFQMHAHSQVSNDTVLILHFVLSGTSHAGTPANVLAAYMSSFLGESTLEFAEVEFDLSDDSNFEPHAKRVSNLCRKYLYVHNYHILYCFIC